MDEDHINAFELAPEQLHTATLLDRLLGKAIADRYADFCRLAAGAYRLNVSRPVAAHVLRELESMVRGVLEVPMEATRPEGVADKERLEIARQQLRSLGYESEAVERALRGLNHFGHKEQIRKIVVRLGFDPKGDIARKWISLVDAFGKAHQRSFHHSLQVDEEFRLGYQSPFDTVLREIAIALEGRYAALMQRVEEIAAMPDRSHAVTTFAREIPGALPLQRHFYQRLTTGDWLPFLAKQRLLGEPLSGADPSGNILIREWPAGDYLRRMASSADHKTRQYVVGAIRSVGDSMHPDIRQRGMDVLAALPAEEAEPLVDLAVAWLDRGASFAVANAGEQLVKALAAGNQGRAALKVAGALLQVWDQNGEIGNLFGRHMYEHALPSLAEALTKACGEDALKLLLGLLTEAAQIDGHLEHGHFDDRAVADDESAAYGSYHALLAATRRSAEAIAASDGSRMRAVYDLLSANPAKIFKRLAMHILATNPSAAPEVADADLLNADLVEQTWSQHEYGELAVAWFPSIGSRKQHQLLAIIDNIPGKYAESWRQRFAQHKNRMPTDDDESEFRERTVRDVMWKWRSVLPDDRRASLDRIVAKHGDPDAWRKDLFPEEVSPLSPEDFLARSVSEIAAFLRTWRRPKDNANQSVSALAHQLREAAGNNLQEFAANADQFVGVKPIYVRHVLEALRSAAENQRKFEWENVLKLIEHAHDQRGTVIDASARDEGDDESWDWASMLASELLRAGLRRGAEGIEFRHAAAVQSLVIETISSAPTNYGLGDFEDRYQRDPYFAAQATLRGIAVEQCILLVFWLSKDTTTVIGMRPKDALNNHSQVRAALEVQLADQTQRGRVPRAIVGRYLQWLFYFGEAWVRAHLLTLFPQDNSELRFATWRAHLGCDQGPIAGLIAELRGCYAEETNQLGINRTDRDWDHYQKRLADYVLILHLWGKLPGEILDLFLQHAPDTLRRHAMAFVGTQVSTSSPGQVEVRSRGHAYWELRLAEAIKSKDPDRYRLEIGQIAGWCLRGNIDPLWGCEQLLQMLKAGFAPTNAYMVVDWLAKNIAEHLDKAVEVLAALLRHPYTERWTLARPTPIRAILAEGLERGAPATVDYAQQTVSFLATIGEAGYLDLLRSSRVE